MGAKDGDQQAVAAAHVHDVTKVPAAMWSANRNVAATRIAIGVTKSAAAHSSPPYPVVSSAMARPWFDGPVARRIV
jgi:hypothetical protein